MGDLANLNGMCPAANTAGLGTLFNSLITAVNAASAANATAANLDVTVGGVFHAGDVLTVTVGGDPVSHTVVGGDTDLAGVAAALVIAINNDPMLGSMVLASAVGAVVTLTALVSGVGFNATTLAVAVTGAGATTTLTREAATFGAGASAGTGVSPLPLLT